MIRLAAAGLTLALLGAACAGPNPDASAKGKVQETTTSTIAKGPETTAAGLRSKLTGLFQEHVFLAAAVASSRSRADELAAAQAALDDNSKALTDNITAIFAATPAVGKEFGELWKGGVVQNATGIGSLFNAAVGLPIDALSGPLTTVEQAI